MLGNVGLFDTKALLDDPGRKLSVAQQFHNGNSGRVAKGLKDAGFVRPEKIMHPIMSIFEFKNIINMSKVIWQYLAGAGLDLSASHCLRRGHAVWVEGVRTGSSELAHQPETSCQVVHAEQRRIDLAGRGINSNFVLTCS